MPTFGTLLSAAGSASSEGRGLADYLAAGASIPELLTKTNVEKLTILSSGSFQANPVELIGSKRMETLVREMRERYSDRYIIFDSSPLLATTEPSVLTRLVDGIILVIRAGVTPRETVQQALATVEREKVLGIVLNDLEFESDGLTSRYFGSSKYYYRYRQKARKRNPKSLLAAGDASSRSSRRRTETDDRNAGRTG